MSERIVTADACVIGTGAGGAPVAALLAEAGMRVAILEEGAVHEPASMTARPRDMMARLYRDGGQLATIGRPPIVLPLGRGLGGTTLVNSGTCFRTPDHVLERWRTDHGLEDLTPEALAPVGQPNAQTPDPMQPRALRCRYPELMPRRSAPSLTSVALRPASSGGTSRTPIASSTSVNSSARSSSSPWSARQRSRTRCGVRKQVPEFTSVVPPTPRPSGSTIGGSPTVAS